MLNIYDNGEMILGKVKDLIEYTVKNCEDEETLKELLEDFEKLNDDDIVALNYDNGMGYSFDYWEQSDKVEEMN